jgi:hypothetical protein
MLKPIARLVFRGSGPNDGIIIGCSIKGHKFFKPNTVYELKEVMGEVIIEEVGKSWLGADKRRKEWGRTFGDIVAIHQNYTWLTKEEYDRAMAVQQAGQPKPSAKKSKRRL